MTGGGDKARRIAFVAERADELFENHLKLIKALHDHDCELCLLAPTIEPKRAAVLASLGGSYIAFTPEMKRTLPFGVGQEIKLLAKHLADWSADCVVGVDLPWIFYAARAGSLAKTARVISIIDRWPEPEMVRISTFGASPMRQLVEALEASTQIVAHNKGIERYLFECEVLADRSRLIVVPGGGVDLVAVPDRDLPPLCDGVTFGMCAKLSATKGVLTFCRAARQVSEAHKSVAHFRLAYQATRGGDFDDAIALEDLAIFEDDMSVSEIDGVSEALDAIAQCHVFVYPALNEGMPAMVLRALATGRAVITSDEAGFRETVDERVNGTLVSAGDIPQLVAAMESYLRRPELIPIMARASRHKAERRFGDTEVVGKLLSVFGYNS